MGFNRSISEVKFHDSATATATGVECAVISDASTMLIDFIDKGTNSTFAAVVEGKVSYESDWDEVMVVDTKTYAMSTTPSNFNSWELDITGLSYVRVRLTNVTGAVSVLGRLVG